eukprot:4107297-Prymnesium_polylepis.1
MAESDRVAEQTAAAEQVCARRVSPPTRADRADRADRVSAHFARGGGSSLLVRCEPHASVVWSCASQTATRHCIRCSRPPS